MVITGLEHRATIFPQIIAGGNYSKEATTATTTTIPLFEGNYSREAIISNIAHDHWKSCLNLFSFIIPSNKKKIITSNKLNVAF